MNGSATSWRSTTHEWAATVDADHLRRIQAAPAVFAPGGLRHLILEIVAYAADEAEATGGGRCAITLHADGSVSVADQGRGTDTRLDENGRPVRKPVMATKDLRFFDDPHAQLLPDGHPRRGMSVVAALSSWLVHTNRRADGAWSQRYEHGLPVSDLTPVDGDGSTGTAVRFRPAETLAVDPATGTTLAPGSLSGLWPELSVEIVAEERP